MGLLLELGLCSIKAATLAGLWRFARLFDGRPEAGSDTSRRVLGLDLLS
ncbi:hypothetical protein ACH47B_28490 [Rhodococcus sp. NPDC019627]